jgi:anti-sigma factor RsiW
VSTCFTHPSLDDLIDAQSAPAMRAHLAACTACQDKARRWNAAAGVMRQLWAGAQPPPWHPGMLPDAAGTRHGRVRRLLARPAGDHRRRVAVRAAVAAAVVVTAASVAMVAVGETAARTGSSRASARTMAYVTKHVENALASENLVFVGRSYSNTWGYAVTWAYGSRNRFDDSSDSGPFLAKGTALVGGKLVDAYVTYSDRKYSLSPLTSQSASACSANAAVGMGVPVIPTTHWADFINSTLACGAASVTGHVLINGLETTKITGKPVTVRLSSPRDAGFGIYKWATARWTLYVNPRTYLPVRIYGSTKEFGGTPGPFTSSFVTNVQWLPPTAANIAKTLLTIPPGFHRVKWPADQLQVGWAA